ncbi:MAG: sedoheptulokinase [Rubinisphaera brasiliensis]|uniref:sedoheptulokinase n=1 Tax=Rubinisphaera brasiliensis TaxID=119 RepID=UPI00391DB0D6
MPILLGLDLGTTSVSAVAIDEAGTLLHAANRAHHAYVDGLPEGHAEQDLSAIEQAARDCLGEILAAISETPFCLALTGQMHGFLFCDAAGSPLSRLITWQDRRCLQADAGEQSPLEELQSRLPSDLASKLGCQIRAGYAIATWFAMQRRGQLPQSDYRLCDVTAAIAQKLTGSQSGSFSSASTKLGSRLKIDPTFAASWGVWDQTQNSYCEEMLVAAGLEVARLPQAIASGGESGRVSAAAAEQWGLPEGMPVVVGIGDNQASFLGAVQSSEEEVLINIGTGGQVAWSHSASTDHPAIEIRPFVGKQFLHVGAGLAGGDAYAWLVSQLQSWLAEFEVSVDEEQIHRILADAHARLTPDEKKSAPVCEPFFRGTRTDPDRRGVLSNLGQNNTQLGQLTHAVIAGVVDCLCELYESSNAPLVGRMRVVVAGNFFQHHRWAADRIAERWQIPVVFPDQREQAARGAALLALRTIEKGSA